MTVKDPFALALGESDSDTDNASPTCVARSPDFRHRLAAQISENHGEVEIDDSQVDAVLAEASVAEVADDSFATAKKRQTESGQGCDASGANPCDASV